MADKLRILTLNSISHAGSEAASAGSLRGQQSCRAPGCHPGALAGYARHGHPGTRCGPMGRAGAGTNNIPVDAHEPARRAGVQCARRERQRGQRARAGRPADRRAQPGSGCALRGRTARQRRRARAAWWRTTRSTMPVSSCRDRTLGILGLGRIGSLVADAAIKLGMNVMGYDPEITVDAAWSLPSQVQKSAQHRGGAQSLRVRYAARSVAAGDPASDQSLSASL